MSAITPELCVGGRDLSEPRLRGDGSAIVYAISEQGVACLVVHSLDDKKPDQLLATDPPLRPARGLGGGAWCFSADETAVAYVAIDGELWLQSLSGRASKRLTEVGPDRTVASPCCAPDGRSVVFAVDDAEIHQLFFDGGQTRRVDDGSADFCFDPHVDSTGMRWQAWNVPDMAWDRSRVQRRIGDDVIDEPGTGCVQQPRVLPDRTPISVRDDSGWLNVWVGDRPLVAEAFEHAGPTWGPGQRTYAWSPDGSRVAFTRNDCGFGRLCVIDTDGSTTPVEVALGVHGQLSWVGERLACVCSDACTPPAVVVYDTSSVNDNMTWRRTVVANSASPDWAATDLVEPQLVEVAAGTDILHARLYRGHGPGLIVWLHGGPTDQWQVSFMARVAYWRARGWNILVPDHRGSTGHGRAYQQALRGQWGILDVSDTVAVTKHAHKSGWGNAATTVIMGSSAGGLTALGAVAADPTLFAASVVLYPVTDLVALAEHSHRFEQHYTDSLIGPFPAMIEEYRNRSPITKADRYTTTPMLILHGDTDPVVPVEQSLLFAERTRAAGGEVELHVYEGEGHGFRQQANQLDEYRRIAGFLARHVPLAFAQ